MFRGVLDKKILHKYFDNFFKYMCKTNSIQYIYSKWKV